MEWVKDNGRWYGPEVGGHTWEVVEQRDFGGGKTGTAYAILGRFIFGSGTVEECKRAAEVAKVCPECVTDKGVRYCPACGEDIGARTFV